MEGSIYSGEKRINLDAAEWKSQIKVDPTSDGIRIELEESYYFKTGKKGFSFYTASTRIDKEQALKLAHSIIETLESENTKG